ncbi:MAG TPA: AgmX/PglI C-terminal domain-containing protein [Kofleriaceae bacterium]|nr:AgmX/PglI C-terminal domain-containing protein [Kofleriaceae bacterium]
MSRLVLLCTLVAACWHNDQTSSTPPPPKSPAPQVVQADAEPVKGDPKAPDLAREQAFEDARDAGILGPTPGQPPPAGPLDKDTIRREVRTHLRRVEFCYEKALLERPTLAGTTTVKFVIAADGHVASATGAGFDPDVDTCVAKVVLAMRFPASNAGDTAVSYPFVFRFDDTP